MGISYQDFRVRIGIFNNANVKPRNKFKCEPKKLKMMKSQNLKLRKLIKENLEIY